MGMHVLYCWRKTVQIAVGVIILLPAHSLSTMQERLLGDIIEITSLITR